LAAGFLGAFLTRAGQEPSRVAIVLRSGGDTHPLTQGALASGGLRWAALFRIRGAKPGDVILLCLPLSSDLIEAFLGALCAGCVPSFMPYPSPKQDPRLFWSSHNLLFARLGGGLIVTTFDNGRAIEANISDATMTIATPGDAAAVSMHGSEPIHPWRGGDIACLQHSSGTTGLKKGVMLSFDAIDRQLDAYTRMLQISADDTIVSWLPLYHDMGFVACLLLPLATGIPSVLLDPFAWLVDPLSLLDAVAEHAGTFAWLPNFAFTHLVNAAFDDGRKVDLGSLRALIDCSEACRPETLAAFEHRFSGWGLKQNRLATCYAMAETVFAISQSRPGQAPAKIRLDRAALEQGHLEPAGLDGVALISSGEPLDGVTLAILDEQGRAVAADRVGQIAVKAGFLFEGYHLEPERSRAVFKDGFYLTGDLGFYADGELYILGRRDDLLILLGRNVFANEVETILAGC
jgi:fatty-acyl-CoA synthase